MHNLRNWRVLLAVVLGFSAALPLLSRPDAVPAAPAAATEWPREWEGAPLRPLALSAVERRFAAQFPGRIARFASGPVTVVLREARRPTRMLHPAADCFRGLGYRIEQARLESDREGKLWRCFVARDDLHALRVCERIESADGQVFTDTSAWFWSASLQHSTGPWRAVTRVQSL